MAQRRHKGQLRWIILIERLPKIWNISVVNILWYRLNSLSFFCCPRSIYGSLSLWRVYGTYLDFIVYVPKNEELRILRSSRDILFIKPLDRFRRSLLLLIRLAIKNYFVFLLSYKSIYSNISKPIINQKFMLLLLLNKISL